MGLYLLGNRMDFTSLLFILTPIGFMAVCYSLCNQLEDATS